MSYRYFEDGPGATDLIRVDMGEWEPAGREDFLANWSECPAQRYSGREYGWTESQMYNLAVVAIHSGDYNPASEAEAFEIVARIDAQRADG